MEIKISRSTSPRPSISQIKSARGGTVTLVEETRLKETDTKESVNLVQVQDRVWKTRWGREYYGSALSAETSLDGAFEFIKDRGKSTEERQLIVCGATGDIYKSTNDGTSWSVISGVTFTGGNPISALQIEQSLYLSNGVDSMAVYNGTTATQYSSISTPTGLGLTRTTLTVGSYNVYYQVTALNEIGETAACAQETLPVNKERNTWSGTEAINLAWTAVSGATRYQIYYSDESGYETFLGSTTSVTFVDDGSLEPNPYIEAPVDDTSDAPKVKNLEVSGNRIWATGDPENPHRVYFSGVGQFISYFSAYYGGGWVDLEYGGREVCIGVVNYRTGKGDEVATVFTRTPEGTGSIWQITLDVATAGDLTFSLPIPVKIVDYIGCTSAEGIIKAGDKVFFPNVNGIFDLGNKEQMFNILVTNEVSESIRPDYRDFDNNALDKMTGYYYDAKLFYSASQYGGENNLIFLYDIERKNWTYYWDFGVKHFFESTDGSGNHHLLYVPTDGNQLVEINEGFDTDFGGAFRTSYISGLYGFKDRIDSFAKVYQGIVEFGKLKGTVNFEILGLGKRGGFKSLANRQYSSISGVPSIDFTNALFSDYMFSTDDEVAIVNTEPTIKKSLRVNKRLNRIQFKVSSTVAGTQYSLLGVQATGRDINMNPPNEWRN